MSPSAENLCRCCHRISSRARARRWWRARTAAASRRASRTAASRGQCGCAFPSRLRSARLMPRAPSPSSSPCPTLSGRWLLAHTTAHHRLCTSQAGLQIMNGCASCSTEPRYRMPRALTLSPLEAFCTSTSGLCVLRHADSCDSTRLVALEELRGLCIHVTIIAVTSYVVWSSSRVVWGLTFSEVPLSAS